MSLSDEKDADGLRRLLAKSLITADFGVGATRYALLESIREFGRDRLKENGEWEATRKQHRLYYMELAEKSSNELTGSSQSGSLSLLEGERDNFRLALEVELAEERDQTEAALRLAGALGRFWQIRGYFGEGREALNRLLEGQDKRDKGEGRDSLIPSLKANALLWAGMLAHYQGDTVAAREQCEEGYALWKLEGDEQETAAALGCLAILAKERGDVEEARSLYSNRPGNQEDMNEIGKALLRWEG